MDKGTQSVQTSATGLARSAVPYAVGRGNAVRYRSVGPHPDLNQIGMPLPILGGVVWRVNEAAILSVRELALDDQGVDDGQAVALRMDEERVEVEFGDMVGVVDGKTRDRLAYGVRSALLTDEFGRPWWCGLDGREEARHEGPEIGQSVGSRPKHNNGNRERDNALLKGQVRSTVTNTSN